MISACYLILIKGFVIGVQFLMSRAYQTLNFHNMKIARRLTCAIFMKISSLWYTYDKDYYRISLPNRILLSTIMKSDLNYLNFTSFGEFSINCAWFQSLKNFSTFVFDKTLRKLHNPIQTSNFGGELSPKQAF